MAAVVQSTKLNAIAARLPQAIQRAQRFLLERQSPAGYWAGCLEADVFYY